MYFSVVSRHRLSLKSYAHFKCLKHLILLVFLTSVLNLQQSTIFFNNKRNFQQNSKYIIYCAIYCSWRLVIGGEYVTYVSTLTKCEFLIGGYCRTKTLILNF